MMNSINKRCRLCALFSTFSILMITQLNAQKPVSQGLPPEVMAWTISTMEPWPDDKYKTLKEAMIDNKIFPPLVFRGGLFPKIEYSFSLDSFRLGDAPPIPVAFSYPKSRPMFSQYLFKKSLDDLVYKAMLANPKNFKYTIWQLPATTVKPESLDKSKDQVKLEVKSTVPDDKSVDHTIKFIPDRKYWKSTFAADIKFNQNKSSVNWLRGEIKNMNIYTYTKTTYNYERNKVTFLNTLTTNFSINNAPSDTLRNYTIGSDELRFNSNFGLKAIKNWNYSSTGEFITAMGTRYGPNSKVKNAAFLSPYTVNIGIGMTYAAKPVMKKPNRAYDVALTINPLAFKYMYSRMKDINLAAYFQKDEEGNFKHELKTFGSNITLIQNVKFSKSLTLSSRFNYFTNYELITCEFENKFDLILNRYFSTTLHLFMRYDDSVAKKEGSDTLLQINEIFAFGFSYRW